MLNIKHIYNHLLQTFVFRNAVQGLFFTLLLPAGDRIRDFYRMKAVVVFFTAESRFSVQTSLNQDTFTGDRDAEM